MEGAGKGSSASKKITFYDKALTLIILIFNVTFHWTRGIQAISDWKISVLLKRSYSQREVYNFHMARAAAWTHCVSSAIFNWPSFCGFGGHHNGTNFFKTYANIYEREGVKGNSAKDGGENKVLFIFALYCFRQFWQMNGLFCGFHVNQIKLDGNNFFQNFVKKLINLSFGKLEQ